MRTSGASRLRALLAELKRRRVFRASGIYVVAAFGALQGAGVLVPALHLPDWTMTLLVVLALIGMPVAVGLAWAFDIVPGGIQRTLVAPADVARSPLAASVGATRASAIPSFQAPDGMLASAGQIGAGAIRPKVAPAVARAAPAQPSVAVVPFLNMSADPDNEIFADGITEDVIAQLSKISTLKVISRASVMPFKTREESLREIGARLGVTTLLEGSVRRVGDRVRIVAQLVDAETDRHLWADTYDRELTDIFSIQSDVALHIAAALEAELSPDERSRIRKEPTTSLQAYRHYLQGRHWFIRYNPEGAKRAIECFSRAVAIDPSYALPYVGMAMAWAELAESGSLQPEDARRPATEAVAHALLLDPVLGDAHCVLAHLKALWDFDWAAAEAEFRRAIELCPGGADAYDLYGRMCAAVARFDEALTLQRRAQELDPLAHRTNVATTLLRAARYDEAATEAGRTLDFDPTNDRAHATLGWAYFGQGRLEDGIAELQRAAALSPEDTQWLAQLGEALGLAGRSAEAREILGRLDAHARASYVTPYHFAFVYTGLGEHGRALDLLERAYAERAGAIYGIKSSFLFAPLRSHPRFQALLARMNLT